MKAEIYDVLARVGLLFVFGFWLSSWFCCLLHDEFATAACGSAGMAAVWFTARMQDRAYQVRTQNQLRHTRETLAAILPPIVTTQPKRK